MKRKEIIPVYLVTASLILYYVLLFADTGTRLAYAIFTASPFLLLWMGYSIIRNGVYTGKELAEGEEWGYADKNKDELGLF